MRSGRVQEPQVRPRGRNLWRGGAGAPPAAAGPPGGPQQQQQQAPPQPQILQTPPDLASAYHTLAGGAPAPPRHSPPLDLAQTFLALQQHDQARQQFNSGLAGLSAALYPGRTSAAWMKTMTGGGEDPNATMGTLVQLQQIQQQNQALLAYQDGIPKMLADAGLSQDYAPLLATNPSLLGDILKNQMGLTGTQTDKEYKQQVKQFQDANPGKPLPPELASEGAWDQNQREAITTRNTTARDVSNDRDAAQKGFTGTKDTLESLRDNLNTIVNAPNLGNVTGGQWYPTTGWLGSKLRGTDDYSLASTIDQITKQLYTEGLGKLVGSRKTQVEIGTVASGLSQLQNTNLGTDAYRGQAKLQLDRVNKALANSYGEAGYTVPDDLQPYLDSSYSSGQRGRTGVAPSGGNSNAAPTPTSSEGQQPATVQTIDDVRKLKSGTPSSFPTAQTRARSVTRRRGSPWPTTRGANILRPPATHHLLTLGRNSPSRLGKVRRRQPRDTPTSPGGQSAQPGG